MHPTENRIQQEIFVWYNNNFCTGESPTCLIFHVPNENQQTKTRVGLISGCADLVVIHFGQLHFVEVKTTNGKQSDNQKRFEKRVKNIASYDVVRSLYEFQILVESWTNQN